VHKPTLLVITGCNGSGKSSFSKALTQDNNSAYDYDLVFLNKYSSLIDNELKERMAHNLSMADLKSNIKNFYKRKI
jgi:predicted ABC-type ATPase